MLMSRRPHRLLTDSAAAALFLFLFLAVFAAGTSAATQHQFSTVAVSQGPNATLVCALVIENKHAYYGGGGGDGGGNPKLQCVSMPDGERMSYPSADIPYTAIAAGKDFLCGLMAPVGGHAAMRWWSFSEEAAANRSSPIGRRLYWGRSLRALSAGGPHACGLSDDHDPSCWEWPQLALPKGLDFSRIALGHDFLCGIVKDNGTGTAGMRCYGGGMAVPSLQWDPAAFKSIAAGLQHACAVDAEGGLVCWADGTPFPNVTAADLPADMTAMALGHNTTCILAGNGTVRCWGVKVPEEYAHTSFVSIEADGDSVCAVMMSNYSVVCWGNDGRFARSHLVFENTMPGACALKGTCPGDVVPGSGSLCGNGGGEGGGELVVCQPSTLPLNASRIVMFSKVAASGGGDSGKKKKLGIVIGVGVASAGALVLAVAGAVFYLVVFRKSSDSKSELRKAPATVRLGESSSMGLCRDIEKMVMPGPERSPLQPARPLGCEEFTLKDLSRLTNAFAEEAKIGCGSFGSVYRATLPDGREVAIKRAERASTNARRRRRFDSEHAFRSELRLLSRVNHRNLVQLYGFCEERGERILVFEFMPHGALHDHLHGGDACLNSPLFSCWEARLRVALDAARGVEYLHCYAVPAIIHRDIKPSNILLDDDWTAKVSDFGLSLASGSAAAASCTSSTAGTVGYMDPEYYRLQELTERSDVYSFGVVLLELVTGMKAIHRDQSQEGSGSPRNVIEFAVPAVETGNIAKILDERVPAPRGHEVEAVARVAKIAAECVRPRGRGRPVMSEVVAELEWAVTLCEECVVRPAGSGGARNTSSRTSCGGDGDMSRSRSRSESDDRSPFHSREFSFGSSRVAGVGVGVGGHTRSFSTM